MSTKKNTQGLAVLLDFLRFTFLGSGILVVALRLYVITKTEDTVWLEQMEEMVPVLFMFAAYFLISWWKKKQWESR
jgi:hypothetical protein